MKVQGQREEKSFRKEVMFEPGLEGIAGSGPRGWDGRYILSRKKSVRKSLVLGKCIISGLNALGPVESWLLLQLGAGPGPHGVGGCGREFVFLKPM